jgi:hypothetical protein
LSLASSPAPLAVGVTNVGTDDADPAIVSDILVVHVVQVRSENAGARPLDHRVGDVTWR